MTRFGMEEEDFKTLTQFIRDVVVEGKQVKGEVTSFRKRFQELKFCFSGSEFEEHLEALHRLI